MRQFASAVGRVGLRSVNSDAALFSNLVKRSTDCAHPMIARIGENEVACRIKSDTVGRVQCGEDRKYIVV